MARDGYSLSGGADWFSDGGGMPSSLGVAASMLPASTSGGQYSEDAAGNRYYADGTMVTKDGRTLNTRTRQPMGDALLPSRMSPFRQMPAVPPTLAQAAQAELDMARAAKLREPAPQKPPDADQLIAAAVGNRYSDAYQWTPEMDPNRQIKMSFTDGNDGQTTFPQQTRTINPQWQNAQLVTRGTTLPESLATAAKSNAEAELARAEAVGGVDKRPTSSVIDAGLETIDNIVAAQQELQDTQNKPTSKWPFGYGEQAKNNEIALKQQLLQQQIEKARARQPVLGAGGIDLSPVLGGTPAQQPPQSIPPVRMPATLRESASLTNANTDETATTATRKANTPPTGRPMKKATPEMIARLRAKKYPDTVIDQMLAQNGFTR